MDLRVSLLLILFCLPLIDGSCFIPTPCTTIRQFIRIIDPCATVTDCENACLGDPECEAYKFISAKCALMGTDSGKPQICTSGDSTCLVRTADCDDATTTTSTSIAVTTTTASTTTSSTQTTTTAASVSTATTSLSSTTTSSTTTTAGTGCGDNLVYALPDPCAGCDMYLYDNTELYCETPGNTLYRSEDNTELGWLSCTNDAWIASEGSVVVAPQTMVFCGPSSASCMGLTYAVPSDSVGCVQPDFGDTQVSCAAGFDLYELGAGEISTLIQGTLDCVSGQWTDGTTIVPSNTAMYCKPHQPVTTTTEATTTTTPICPQLSYAAPNPCSGCTGAYYNGVKTSCAVGPMYSYDGAVSTLMGGPLECVAGGQWYNPSYGTDVPASTKVYCTPG